MTLHPLAGGLLLILLLGRAVAADPPPDRLSPARASPDRAAHDRSPHETRALRDAVRAGRVVPLERILADALARVGGRVVDVEYSAHDDEYEIEILDPRGRVWELEYRASSGEFIEMERD